MKETAFRLATLLLAIPLTAVAAEKAERITFTSEGSKRVYYYFAPSDSPTPLPLLILLHGSGHIGSSMTDIWSDLAAKEHFLIAAPDSSNSTSWRMKGDGLVMFRDLVEDVKTRHLVDAGRVYVFGHSAGAQFALVLALLESEYFSAVALHAGALRQENQFLMEYLKRKIPITIFVGDRDPMVPADSVKKTKALFQKAGHDVVTEIIPNHDHNYYRIATELNPRIWDFLKSQVWLDPKFREYPRD